MRIESIIRKINNHTEKNEFVDARKLIELNLQSLLRINYREKLNANARDLVRVVTENKGHVSPLTREEMLWVNAVNKAAREFNLLEWKLLWKDKLYMKDRPEISDVLTGDVKALLDTIPIEV